MTLKIKCAYIDFGTFLRKGGILKNIIAGIFAVVMLGIIFVLIIPSSPTMGRNFVNQDKNHTEPTPTATVARAPTATATPTPIPTPTPRTILVLATAYNGTEFGSDNVTATGTRTRRGVIAVDPRVIPLGTQFSIDFFPGRIFTAEDTGGGVKGAHIDIWMPLKEAKQWGAKEVWVTLLE